MSLDLFKAVPDPHIGRTLDGRYEVLSRLGEGGVGVVYRAKQVQLGRMVAIKVLHQDAAVIPEWRARFQREARALSALAHPNVVPVTDSGIDRGVPYLVMELLQGQTLSDLIKAGPLPLWRALDIARQTLRGLAFAHTKAIVHRDLKPANVFLQALPDQTDHVRLLDFGMAKFLEGSSGRTMSENLTRAGVVFGTPAYMSPEMVKGAAVDTRTDVYAAGVMLFELLAGRRPFNADSYEGYMGAHLTQPVPSLAQFRPGFSAAPFFQSVVEKAMAKKASARFKDAGAMLAALEAAIAKLPAAATSRGRAEARKKPTPHAGTPTLAGGRFLRRAIVVVTLAAGIAAAGTYVVRDRVRSAETAAPAEPPKRAPVAAAPRKPALPPPLPPKPAEPPPPAPSAAPVASAEPPAKPAVAGAEAPPKPALAPETPPKPVLAADLPPRPALPPPKLAPPLSETPEPAKRGSAPVMTARDPWREPVPRVLKPIRDRVARGGKVSQRALKPVYAFAHENPDDPRPWLLLGHVYAELDWYSDSIERYQKALRIDSSSRGDPNMLPDMLKAVVHPVAGRVGARAVRDIYGAEAIPAIEKAMERRASDSDAAARLARLRESLPR